MFTELIGNLPFACKKMLKENAHNSAAFKEVLPSIAENLRLQLQNKTYKPEAPGFFYRKVVGQNEAQAFVRYRIADRMLILNKIV